MIFTLKVESDNDALTVDPQGAIAEILKDVADRIVDGAASGALRDANGNTVGRFELDY